MKTLIIGVVRGPWKPTVAKLWRLRTWAGGTTGFHPGACIAFCNYEQRSLDIFHFSVAETCKGILLGDHIHLIVRNAERRPEAHMRGSLSLVLLWLRVQTTGFVSNVLRALTALTRAGNFDRLYSLQAVHMFKL